VARLRYVADTSVFARLSKPTVAGAFTPLAVSGEVAITAPVIFELGFSARNARDHRRLRDDLMSFPLLATTDADHRRALEVQSLLADRGRHRAASLVDALVAATAEGRGLVILHYDSDFETIAAATGQAQQWIIKRGTAD